MLPGDAKYVLDLIEQYTTKVRTVVTLNDKKIFESIN